MAHFFSFKFDNNSCFVFIFTVLLTASGLRAETPNRSITIIKPQDLSSVAGPIHYLDCRSNMSFRRGRIPGSQHVDWKSWTQEKADLFGLWFGKPERAGLSRLPNDKLQTELRKLGLSNEEPIVVIGDHDGWGAEGRIAWNLLYWGAKHVYLLDGGFTAWLAVPGHEGEIGPIQIPAEGHFQIHLVPERRANIEDVKNALNDSSRVLIDTRSKEEYDGKKLTGQKRGGHLPGAWLYPDKDLYDDMGLYIAPEKLKSLSPKQGLGTSPISYCTGGVRSALYAMLWEAYFGEIVANYEGSLWEWGAHPELPLN